MILFTIPFFYVFNYSQSIDLSNNKVVYDLPYPGILPDHPLYFLKAIRDKLQDFFTRDNIKKAQLYLLYSDKRLAMTLALEKKGEDALAFSTLSKGEKYFLKIPDLLRQSKEQGTSPSAELVGEIKLSNQKHEEVIRQMLQELPQGNQESINQTLKMTDSIHQQLQSF